MLAETRIPSKLDAWDSRLSIGCRVWFWGTSPARDMAINVNVESPMVVFSSQTLSLATEGVYFTEGRNSFKTELLVENIRQCWICLVVRTWWKRYKMIIFILTVKRCEMKMVWKWQGDPITDLSGYKFRNCKTFHNCFVDPAHFR